MAVYELWETRSGNLMDTFATQDEALTAVREAIDLHGQAYVDSLALGRENSRGRSKVIARGAELALRAQAAAPSPEPKVAASA